MFCSLVNNNEIKVGVIATWLNVLEFLLSSE